MTDDRLRRILIHPGFHKTGTSSIQHFLWINRAALTPHVAILQLRHLKPVAQLCMSFSRNINPLMLADLVEPLDAALADFGPGPGDTRDIVVSCEALSGHCPGWPGVLDFSAAPYTATVLAGYFAERFPGADIFLVYSTREPETWLRSAWGHHLFGQRLKQGFEDFAAWHRNGADLTAAVLAVAEAIAPVQVFSLPIEESATHPLGPGGALLELIDLPEDLRLSLQPVGHGNRGPQEALAAEYLALNRAPLTDPEVKARKAHLAEQAKVGGWVTSAED